MRLSRNTPPAECRAAGPALHGFALFTAAATLVLLGLGGLVTSHGVGMAVPDWPNTYGYNMFFFPISKWMGGIFYEHTHRLLASAVGLLTSILALWLYGSSARPFMRWSGLALLVLATAAILGAPHRPADALVLALTGLALFTAGFLWPRCEPSPKWLRRLGLIAFCAVVFQGVLGGLRVVLFKDQIGIFHAALAQLFLVLLCSIALFTSRWWQQSLTALREAGGVERNILSSSGAEGATSLASPVIQTSARKSLSFIFLAATLLIFAQLLLGATMRHQHAGLAIPDFPLAYGKLWPAMDPASVELYNQQRLEMVAANPITALQIGLQMVHRLVAVLVFGAVVACFWAAWRKLGLRSLESRLALGWLGLILAQVLLGAATIWSNKAADIATAHMLVGALSLALGAILCIVCSREWLSQLKLANAPPAAGPAPAAALPLRPSTETT